jgi:hypothetical protein
MKRMNLQDVPDDVLHSLVMWYTLGAVGSETAVAAAVGTDARLGDHPKKES